LQGSIRITQQVPVQASADINPRPDTLGVVSLVLGMLLVAAGYAPVIRRAMGVEEGISFLSVVLLLAAGLMAGLSGMMLLARSEAADRVEKSSEFPSENRYAALCHVGALLIWLGIPLGNFILPYLCWRRVRRQSSFVDRHGISSINFQLSVTLYQLIAVLLFYLIAGLLMMALVMILHLLLSLFAARQALSGREFSYPMSIRFIRPADTA
jgi:uncharacterized Tic20 family protein